MIKLPPSHNAHALICAQAVTFDTRRRYALSCWLYSTFVARGLERDERSSYVAADNPCVQALLGADLA